MELYTHCVYGIYLEGENMDKLTASVGNDAKNRRNDVILIQKLLNDNKITGEITPLKVDGIIGDKTINRIKVFQKRKVFMSSPDGRVDPNGKTFKKLAAVRAMAKTAKIYNLSTKAVELLQGIETLATKPYDDQTALDITAWVKGATIGYGHLISKSDWPKYKDGFTKDDALKLFNADLSPFVAVVKSKVKASITQNEFDAMTILAFNIGVKGFSDSSVLKIVNDPGTKTTFKSLESAWKAWNKSDGRINKGLTNRRNAEWNIYSKGIYQRW